MNKTTLINYLNTYLEIENFNDSSKNWLQIDNSKTEIKKIWYAVDATSYIFQKAKKENVDLVLSHHGIFWWYENVLVWVPYKRAKLMLENDIALGAYHLPLDAHPEVGNNAWLYKGFLEFFKISDYKLENIIEYKWKNIWFWLKFKKEIPFEDIETYLDFMKLEKNIYNFWNKKTLSSIAFCSGWAWSEVDKIQDYDVFLTWEAAHHEITFAKELEQSVIYAGHYETEKVGPELLAKHLQEKFWVEIVFLDEKY